MPNGPDEIRSAVRPILLGIAYLSAASLLLSIFKLTATALAAMSGGAQ
ncbi:hypothetical protein [Sphingobium agri]|nr:hypothetical protein [Sphingobium agri]